MNKYELDSVKEFFIFAAFCVCMYCGFKEGSGVAFFGAVIAFFNIGCNKIKL